MTSTIAIGTAKTNIEKMGWREKLVCLMPLLSLALLLIAPLQKLTIKEMWFSPSPVLVESMVILSCAIYLLGLRAITNKPDLSDRKKIGIILLAYLILLIAPIVFFGDILTMAQGIVNTKMRKSVISQAELFFFSYVMAFGAVAIFGLRKQRAHHFAGMQILVLMNCLMCVAAMIAFIPIAVVIVAVSFVMTAVVAILIIPALLLAYVWVTEHVGIGFIFRL